MLKFIANRNSAFGPFSIALHIGQIEEQGPSLAEPLAFRHHQKCMRLPEDSPTVSLTESEAQELLTELLRVGVRLPVQESLPGETAAMKDHLADLKKLIFERRVK